MNTENNPWKIVDATTVYTNNWIEIIHHNVINPVGNKGVYGKVCFKNYATAIVPIDNEMNTYLVGQYRFPTNHYSWEVPEGGCPLHEEPLVAAQRELQEETGLIAQTWQSLGTAHLSNSVSNEVGYFFLAQNLSQTNATPEETEQLIIKKLPLITAFKMVEEGIIVDAMAVMALQKVELMMLKGLL